MHDRPAYNPMQQKVIELLGKNPDRELLPSTLRDDLLAELSEAFDGFGDLLDPNDPLWVSKHALASVHGCEGRYLAGEGAFEWTVASVRGTVVHRAIEYMINWRGDPIPADLVDESIARIVGDEMHRANSFVAGLDPYDLAELRGVAVDLVTKFAECFPPLKKEWRPVTESSVRTEIANGAIVLSGKTDLTLGVVGDKVIVDVKSGRVSPMHREDLRFYALVELLRAGSAPRKVATYYLDSARAHPEDVTEGMLRSAARRTVDAVERIVLLKRAGEQPTLRPGPHCRWCPIQDECETGKAALLLADSPDNDTPPW